MLPYSNLTYFAMFVDKTKMNNFKLNNHFVFYRFQLFFRKLLGSLLNDTFFIFIEM